MEEILSKEDIEYLSNLTEEDVERLKKDKEYSYIFPEEVADKLKAIEEQIKREKEGK
jgi:hypothetical protein